jgi:hypothetical protein
LTFLKEKIDFKDKERINTTIRCREEGDGVLTADLPGRGSVSGRGKSGDFPAGTWEEVAEGPVS